MKSRQFNFSDCELDYIEDALLLGLTEHGTLENVRDSIETLKMCSQKVDITAPHPTGTSDVVERFATALTIVSIARRHQAEQVAE